MPDPYEKLSMSAITALFHLYDYMRINGCDIEDAYDIVPHSTSEYAPHDYEGALLLARFASFPDIADLPRSLRSLLYDLIKETQPGWLSVVQTGRDAVRPWLTSNAFDVFTQAELFSTTPNIEVVEWWDKLAMRMWASTDPALLRLGRQAERQSFELERARLAEEQCSEVVQWISLDDNTAGFDIASWKHDGHSWVPLLIEVKSTVNTGPTFYLSRNEFETAKRARSNYIFHIWVRNKLCVLDRDTVVSAAPIDTNTAHWENAIFSFS